MKNLEQRDGFTDRHTDSLPKEKCTIRIITTDMYGEQVYLCEWRPFDKNSYSETNMPGDGYLGTAKVIEGGFTGIGFHAWQQNDSEFVWYAVV